MGLCSDSSCYIPGTRDILIRSLIPCQLGVHIANMTNLVQAKSSSRSSAWPSGRGKAFKLPGEDLDLVGSAVGEARPAVLILTSIVDAVYVDGVPAAIGAFADNPYMADDSANLVA